MVVQQKFVIKLFVIPNKFIKLTKATKENWNYHFKIGAIMTGSFKVGNCSKQENQTL
jgi:hypothetical protein